MYAAGVHADGKLAVVIVLAKAQPDQMNLYFQNLFTIMCGLVESAMVRAFDYENVARQAMLVPGTEFLNTRAVSAQSACRQRTQARPYGRSPAAACG